MLLDAHSGSRYLVLILGVAVILYAGYGMVTGRPYDKTMRILASSFTAALDLTVLFGLGLVFTGTFYPALAGHIMTMLLAVAVAHIVAVVIRKRPLEQRTYAPHLVSAVIVLGLLTVGAMAIGRSILR
jgi:cation transport ATPase